MKYCIITFGCQMNLSDSERIASVLEKSGYKQTPKIGGADLVVVNMCSVRQTAVDRIFGLRQKFTKSKIQNPNLKTILTGCMLSGDKKKFSDFFDYVVDMKDIKKLPKIIKKDTTCKMSGRTFYRTNNNYLAVKPKYFSKFSANVPVMTGCNNFCAYCVVPYTRGREVSRPAKEIISEIKNLIKGGVREIWLLGQNVNSYKQKLFLCDYDRSDKGRVLNFPKLLKMVNNIPGEFWIRFTSSHPKPSTRAKLDAGLADFFWNNWNELIKVMARCKKVTPYLNLPIQSGDDQILKKMNRPYSVAQYKNLVKKIRKTMPDISLSTDVIVGFPGETKKQFENTAKLFREIKFDMAYINKYSPRAGTVAGKLKDNIPLAEKKRREKVLTEILKATALSHNKKLFGKETIVLINENRGDNYFGKNEHYKTIKINSDRNLLGKFVKVKITEAQPFILKGEII